MLVEGKKILAVGPNLHAGDADGDRRARPHRHAGLHRHASPPVRDGAAQLPRRRHPDQRRLGHAERRARPTSSSSCSTFAPVYRPQDVYINELFGGLSQLDDGVTTVHDVSQIHHSPQHSDAAIQALFDTGRRAAFGYFESAGRRLGHRQPVSAATRRASRSSGSRRPTSSSHDHGRRGLSRRATTDSPGRSGASSACRLRRTSSRRSASARSSTSSPQGQGGNSGTSASDPTTCSST